MHGYIWLVLVCIFLSGTSSLSTISLVDTIYTVREGEQLSILVQKQGTAASPVNVVLEVESPSLHGGEDFIGTSQPTVFPPGTWDANHTVIFYINNDDIPEEDETFSLLLRVTNGDGTTGEHTVAMVTITANDEAYGIFGFASPSQLITTTEIPGGENTVTLLVQRTRGTYGTVQVFYQIVSNLTQSPDLDLVPSEGEVTFAPGESTKILQLTVMPDGEPENDEVFTVQLIGAEGGTSVSESASRPQVSQVLTQVQAQVLIRQNDAPVRFSQSTYQADEMSFPTTIQLTVTRGVMADGSSILGPISAPATVSYVLLSNTATLGVDVEASNGSVSFGPGTTQTTIALQVLNDEEPEVAEQIKILLHSPSGDIVLKEPYEMTITIGANDDPNGVISFKSEGSIPIMQINEDTGPFAAIFPVLRGGGAYGAVTVAWDLVRNDSMGAGSGGNTDLVGVDVTPPSGTLTFGDGEKERNIILNIIQDTSPEPTELFSLRLLASTVTGGARVEGIITGQLVVQDSDDVYGVLQFTDDSAQTLVTSTSPRRLMLSVSRTGGTHGDILLMYNVTAPGTDVLVAPMPSSSIVPSGQAGHTFHVEIRDQAFLQVGAFFDISLLSVQLSAQGLAFNTPRLGSKVNTQIAVTPEAANGEVAFADTTEVTVMEPGGGRNQVAVAVQRDGTNGNVQVHWNIQGAGPFADRLTEQDVQPLSGVITMASGQALANIVFEILPDDLPETEEQMTLTITEVTPAETQRLRPSATQVKIVIKENDSPGGIFQFAEATPELFVVQEEEDAIELSIIREGGALVSRTIEYQITPNGEEEFYGSTNVLKFAPGEVSQQITVLARGDGIPELIEAFTLTLHDFEESGAQIGERSKINIEVLENDGPYGIVTFEPGLLVFANESKGNISSFGHVPVQRLMGRFGTVTVDWSILEVNSTDDLDPVTGSLTFYPGEGEKMIELLTKMDELPEEEEMFTINLTNPSNNAVLGPDTSATLVILKNDDSIYFKEPSMVFTSEPSTLTLTVTRDGDLEHDATVLYRTGDGTATESGRDFVPLVDSMLVFGVDEREQNLSVTILDDDVPEALETFYVELYAATGDVAVYGTPTATVQIIANDDARGIFRFAEPLTRNIAEGSPLQFEILRDRGYYGDVEVYWELFENITGNKVQAGIDFTDTEGFVLFSDLQQTAMLTLTPFADTLPEFDEIFSIKLHHVKDMTVDIHTQPGRLADHDTAAVLVVLENDDPYGVFSFPAESREKSIAEDFSPAASGVDSTSTMFMIEREQGKFRDVQIVWEIFSYQIAGAGNLPQLWDLLFLADVLPADNVSEVTEDRRLGTGTMALKFDGCQTCFLTVPPASHPPPSVIASGFSVSVWIKATQDTDGYLLAKTSPDGARHYYALRVTSLSTEAFTSSTLEFRYSVPNNQNNLVAARAVDVDLQDNRWHFLLLTVDDGQVQFYLDGQIKGYSTLAAPGLLDMDDGVLLVGAMAPGEEHFQGIIQDLRIFSRSLDPGEIRELYESPSVKDVRPISGYVTFAENVTVGSVSVHSLDDHEEEADEVFAVKLISARGGARISENDAAAILTVLKSDNANGLFGFSGPCQPDVTEDEAALFTCPVERERGDTDTVTVQWAVVSKRRAGEAGQEAAHDDFVNATGEIVFQPGERNKIFSFQALDDDEPELREDFEVVLVSAVSADGIGGSTSDSGASVKQEANIITVLESDCPFGLLEFSVAEIPPQPSDPRLTPAEETHTVNVAEEIGSVSLMIVRAQGLLGTVTVEWRTIDGTAVSEGKSPPDFQAGVGLIEFTPDQRFQYIQVPILDNTLPEGDKYFHVELVNPTAGAKVGTASTIRVNIQHSDHAYGVFMVDVGSLEVYSQEEDGQVTVKVVREGGPIGDVNVTWEVTSDPGNDLVDLSGTIFFLDGQVEGYIPLTIVDDSLPELDELFQVYLTSVSMGSLGNDERLVSNVTILASDDPYGVYIIAPEQQQTYVTEGEQVTLSVIRSPLSGTFGTVRIHYRTLAPDEVFAYLPGGYMRADRVDYDSTARNGSVLLEAGDGEGERGTFNVTGIYDDDVPEVDEMLFVILTSVELIQGEQDRKIVNSPRLGEVIETYSQVIIEANDDANGVVALSTSTVYVPEKFTGIVCKVIRTGGNFGMISVKFDVLAETASYGLDYLVTSTDIVLAEGEMEKPVPVEIINDRLPEIAETFVIRLLPELTGGAELGNITESTVTILESDDPYGAFGFEKATYATEEPEEGETMFKVAIVRTGGTLGMVAVDWMATLDGGTPTGDISPTSGTVFFVSNEARQSITVSVFADDDPEGMEDIVFTLVDANNGGRIEQSQSSFVLSILPNDNPHGTVHFAHEQFIVLEEGGGGQQYVTVNRSGGSYGDLNVTYSITEMNLLTETDEYSYFLTPVKGEPLLAGNTWTSRGTMTCAQFCLITEVCLGFASSTDALDQDCLWYTEMGDVTNMQPTPYLYYMKNEVKVNHLYEMQAKQNFDFLGVDLGWILIGDSEVSASIPITILDDQQPELNETFIIFLKKVQLVSGPPMDPSNVPILGNPVMARVNIASNDNANGVFRIYSSDPRALDGGQKVEVEERDRLAVELIVERGGGTIGEVSVTWTIDLTHTTATKGNDMIADDATLTFAQGETHRVLTLGIMEDDLPEDDEVIVVRLTNPQGQAEVGPQGHVTVVIMANDHVAGKLGFLQTSTLAKEGDLIRLTVGRSLPALGRVTVAWSISGVSTSSSPPLRFKVFTGSLLFQEGETEKTIILHIKVDNKPKVNEEYHVILLNPRTEGVRETGAAGIDPDADISIITIEGGNEPHGVFSFSPSALDKEVNEDEGVLELKVDRKFGNIGAVKVHYEVTPGALSSLGAQLVLATGDLDFLAVSSYVTFYEGESSGVIPVNILQDELPEIDEVFLVTLKRVELLELANTTFQPRLDIIGTQTEVIISANDGTQGELMFAPQSAVIQTEEYSRNLTLLVRRSKGTFGAVSVFCFAQSSKDGAVRGEDFLFDPLDIHFGAGVTEQIITVQILEDTKPEPEELFEIMLASPKNGANIGDPGKALITILPSDEANGIINFESSDPVTINEPPSSSSTSFDTSSSTASNTVARLVLQRAPGIFGEVRVPFVVLPQGQGQGQVDDLEPAMGVIVFQDRQASATLEISAVADDIPEEAEYFVVVLQPAEGGATLGSISQKTIIIERNDAPYGSIEIKPHETSDEEIEVDETVGVVYFDVTRNSGAMDWVSVELNTMSSTARAYEGDIMHLSRIQQFHSPSFSKWYTYEAFGYQYALLLGGQQNGVLTSSSDLAGSDKSTVLYRWQGALIKVQSIEMDGASSATVFVIEDQPYMILTNQLETAIASRLYRINEQDGTLTVVQDLTTRGATSSAYFTHNAQHFLVVVNGMDDGGSTATFSDVFQWDSILKKFGSVPIQNLATKGGKDVHVLEVDGNIYIALANMYDSDTKKYELSCVIYKVDSSSILSIHQQIPTLGSTDLTSFVHGGDTYLVVVNSRDDVGSYRHGARVYVWDVAIGRFASVQEIQGTDCHKAEVFMIDKGVYLSLSCLGSPSTILHWEDAIAQFEVVWEGEPSLDLHPLTISWTVADNEQEVEGVMILEGIAGNSTTSATLRVNQLAMISDVSDYVKRSSRIVFSPGQTVVTVGVEVLDDAVPEDTETLYVELGRPQHGAELGSLVTVPVHILSNDDGHGIIGFAEDSLIRYEEEIPGRENQVQINVVREKGVSGRVIVRWKMTGEHNGVYDVQPVEGLMELADGQSAATINLRVRDDGLPEGDERSTISLLEVIEGGSNIEGRGAALGKQRTATLVVLANDSPHGVVGWEKMTYMTSEPQGTDEAVTLYIVRQQGDRGHIKVSYITETWGESPAVSGRDYVAVQATVDMYDGVNRVPIYITILADTDPEISEHFSVRLTDVLLVDDVAAPGAAPSVRHPASIAVVTIAENDNARGTVDFQVDRNAEGRIDTYEGVGTITLKLRRRVGFFGNVTVTWQASPREADQADFSPSGGSVTFTDGQLEAQIEIQIVDDDVPEDLQTFDVKLLRVTTGGATLGTDSTVRVGILRNDSPNGVFSFVSVEKSVKESVSMTDREGVVNIDVQRRGTDGQVNVQWRLSADAANDFVPPLSGTLTFNAGEQRKTLSLRTAPDSLLEGEETFTISLVSASNNGVISPTEGDARIIILSDPGASGTVSITSSSQSIVIGEPTEGYNGRNKVSLSRGGGIYGQVRVTWQITPRDAATFTETQGELTLVDMQQQGDIIVQTKDDSLPEQKQTYLLELTSASGGATIDGTARTAQIAVVASDHPHGLFEFQQPAEMTVNEDGKAVTVKVVRNYGIDGQVNVGYSTSPGTATSEDYMESSGTLSFTNGQRVQDIILYVIDDTEAEGPQEFYVNLTSVQLIEPLTNDYTILTDNLQLDMPPSVGPLSVKTVVIGQNDGAQGTVQFSPSAVRFVINEDAGVAQIPLTRGPGTFGTVGVRSIAVNGSAFSGLDYVFAAGQEVMIEDGEDSGAVNVTIMDDTQREYDETFQLILIEATGGASLGPMTTATVTIAKSDYPNGKFSFVGQSEFSIPNPASPQTITLTLQRTEGGIGQQTVYWRIMGPNNPNVALEETNDLSYFMPTGREGTSGSLSWADGELGPLSFTLTVKARTGWEIEKTFHVMMYNIEGFPATQGDGEAVGNVAIKIEKYGHPNGIVRFDGLAQVVQMFEEPATGERSVLFPIVRQEGIMGDVKILWQITGSDGDVASVEGEVRIEEGRRNASITVNILADDKAELDETLVIRLYKAEGGAEIDQNYNTSTFKIRHNDFPHGRFSLHPDYQTVVVAPSDLKRRLRLNITRSKGTEGQVRVSFALRYDQAQSGISYIPSAGSVLFNSSAKGAIVHVNIESDVFLVYGSSFTVSLTAANFIGVGVTMPPDIITELSVSRVMVPAEAANSQVGLKFPVIAIDEETNLARLSLYRLGTYGIVHVDWQTGFVGDTVERLGAIVPDSGTESMQHGQGEVTFNVKVLPSSESELFAVSLPRQPSSLVGGGATLRDGYLTSRMDPHGMIRFAQGSRVVTVGEREDRTVEVVLTVERVFGSQGSIQVRYQTVSGTASTDADFIHISNSAVRLDAGQITSNIIVMIKSDSIPETDEDFFVNLTSTTKLPTDSSQALSPRLSTLYSSARIVIAQNSDPHGVLSIRALSPDVMEPGSVDLLVERRGGNVGEVVVQVRTVGGGESWDRFIGVSPGGSSSNNTIGEALGNRNPDVQATAGQDYQWINETLVFKDGESQKVISLFIMDDDIPEAEEVLYVYLQPLTDGIRVAQPDTDDGYMGYTMVRISPNDYWSGWVGFHNADSVQADEDAQKPAELTIERRNATFGALDVYWRAVVAVDSDQVTTADLDLTKELPYTSNKAECPAKVSSCTFSIPLQHDTVPENQTSFYVELTSTSSGAQIDPMRRYAHVVMLPSDHPNGLLEFVQRYVYVNTAATVARLTVQRRGYTGKQVRLTFRTEAFTAKQLLGGLDVYQAIPSRDYTSQSGELTFAPGETTKTIDVVLRPTIASTSLYPKIFSVVLGQVNQEAELGNSVSLITVTKAEDQPVWHVWAQAQRELNDTTIDILMEDLNRAVDTAGGILADDQLTLTKNILGQVITFAETSPLSSGNPSNIMAIFCRLLNPNNQDATVGHYPLAKLFERFVFSLVTEYSCESCCSPRDRPISSPRHCEYVSFGVAKWPSKDINGYQYVGTQQNTFSLPSNLLADQSNSENCFPVAFIEYNSDKWFKTDPNSQFLSQRVFGVSIKDEPQRFLSEPTSFRIHTPKSSVVARRYECVYYDEDLLEWTPGKDVCSVKNEFDFAMADYVDCSCKHMSHYAVQSELRNLDYIGYPIWFHISCFICIAGVTLAILAHHVCSVYSMFSANLLMHMCFALIATEICYVINAFISPSHLLNISPEDSNYRCIIMSLVLHYFFLAQFTWMMTQAINFWKILVLNDEHTERKLVAMFLLGWGLPVILIFVFYVVSYSVYHFAMDGPDDRIYGDANLNQDICFITSPYAALGGVIGPVLICLIVVGVVFIQAFQVTPQWQAYDDVYRGHYNIHEIRTLLLFWGCIVLVWLWGGLHLAFGQMWMLVLFCICNIITGLYAFVVYAVLRNPCFPCCKQQVKMAAYSVNGTASEISPPSVMGSAMSVVPPEPIWEKASLPPSSTHVKRSPATNLFVLPPYSANTVDSHDLDDLIFALKTGGNGVGGGYTSDSTQPIEKPLSGISQMEKRRINIPDTHL